jgi:MFS family permease
VYGWASGGLWLTEEEVRKQKGKTRVHGRGRSQATVSVANMVNSADTQLLSNLYPQVGASLGLGLAQLGAATTVRAILQSTTAPIWGWWGDKHSRRRILSVGCFAWAVFTILTGLALPHLYLDLVLWQALTGVGLAVLAPTAQSIIADYYPPDRRGKAFGIWGLGGLLGAIFGTIFATALAGTQVAVLGFTVEGWRFVFVGWGVLSILMGLIVIVFSRDPLRGGLEPELVKTLTAEKAARYKPKKSDYKRILTNRTFLLILLQGVAGSMPWTGLLFIITWLQYVGFEPLTSGIVLAFMMLGTALGNVFGGIIGDRASRWRPRSGRIVIAQISVFSGIPMTYVMFVLIPMQTSSMLLYMLSGAFTGFLISWCGGGCNSPIFSEIFEPEIRSSVYAVDTLVEGSVGALGTFLVGAIAEIVFGYQTPTVEIPSLPPAVRATNMLAISRAMFFIAFVPWTLCLIFYTLVYLTYPRDAEKLRKTMEQRKKEIEK